jgi:hypothetical protein
MLKPAGMIAGLVSLSGIGVITVMSIESKELNKRAQDFMGAEQSRDFGSDNVEPILGVTALESAGITVDPTSQQLKRLPAIPLK